MHQCQQIIQHLLLHGIHRNFYLPTHVMTKINITKSAMLVLSNYLVSLKNKKLLPLSNNHYCFYSLDINFRISSRLRSFGPLSKCNRSSSNSSIDNGSSPKLFLIDYKQGPWTRVRGAGRVVLERSSTTRPDTSKVSPVAVRKRLHWLYPRYFSWSIEAVASFRTRLELFCLRNSNLLTFFW